MKTFGITGTIGSGKSTLSILLRRRHLPVFNADVYSRTAFQKTAAPYAAVVDRFGTSILDANGEIDRRALAGVVFADEEKRVALDEIVHPYVKEGLLRFLNHHSADALVFAEVPLLFEAGWEDLFDKVIVVTCERETAIRRLMEDRDFTREEAEARLSHQIDPSVQIAKADVVFHNDGSIKDLDRALGSWLMKQRKERHGTGRR